jgi:hypothetical protein
MVLCWTPFKICPRLSVSSSFILDIFMEEFSIFLQNSKQEKALILHIIADCTSICIRMTVIFWVDLWMGSYDCGIFLTRKLLSGMNWKEQVCFYSFGKFYTQKPSSAPLIHLSIIFVPTGIFRKCLGTRILLYIPYSTSLKNHQRLICAVIERAVSGFTCMDNTTEMEGQPQTCWYV